jgi:hypothetical protein
LLGYGFVSDERAKGEGVIPSPDTAQALHLSEKLDEEGHAENAEIAEGLFSASSASSA